MFKKILLTFVILGLFLCGKSVLAKEDYWDNLGNRLGETLIMMNEFNELLGKEDIDLSTIKLKLDNLITHTTETLSVLSKPKPATNNADFDSRIEKIKKGLTTYNQGLTKLKNGIYIPDEEEINNAITLLDDGSQLFAQNISDIMDEYKKLEQQDKETSNAYLIGTIVFGLISILLFIKSMKKSKYPTEQVKTSFYISLFKTSLWPVGGFLFTLISFNTSTSGKYTIASGAIVIGVLSLINQLFNYFWKVRPTLKKFIEAEKFLIDNYDDLLKLFHRVPQEDFIDVVVGKYKLNRKSAELLLKQILGFMNDYHHSKTEETKDPYDVLGVSKEDSLEQIKQAYRTLAKKYHPDVAGKNTEEMFKEINIAYTTILMEKGAH